MKQIDNYFAVIIIISGKNKQQNQHQYIINHKI